MISKACVVGVYQKKLEELALLPGIELSLVVPPYWRDGRQVMHFEKAYTTGYDVHVLPMALNGHFHLHFYPGLGALVRNLRPHIVHIDEEPYNLASFQAMRLARSHGAKALIFTWQNLLRRYPFPFSLFEQYNLRHAASVLAGNQEAARVLRAKGYSGPVHVLPQFGVDPDLYRKEQPSPRHQDKFVIGYVGRLVEEKGVQVLLRTFEGFQGNWILHIVGDGPYRPTLQSLSAELDLGRRALFQPWIPSAEIPHQLNELDVLVLPSLTRQNWKEQFGRVLIEAMACEVPVMGSSCGEIPNLIADAGLIFPEGDESALQDALRQLMREPWLRNELGRAGRARVLEHYTQKRIAADTCAVYSQLLAPS